ncbi:MAG: hypothetical protein ACR2KV_13445 [Solirubrobacteraceae bacterium]
MDTDTKTASQTKQITVDVPAERVPEFYAFFGRFLAGGRGRGRGGHHRRPHGGPGHPGHHRCGEHRADAAQSEGTAAPAGTTSV